MTSPLEPAIETQTQSAVDASIIWLHGLGADGYDFAGIIPELQLPPHLGIRFIFPHAPRRAVTLNNGYVMRAWYDLALSERGLWQDLAHIDESVEAISALIKREMERGIAPQRIIVSGFSQGGVMTLHTALRAQQRLAGAIVLSAPLIGVEELLSRASATNAKLPMFFGYGRYDQIGPMSSGQHAMKLLRERGYEIEWRDYPMEHSVCGEEILEIGKFIERVLR